LGAAARADALMEGALSRRINTAWISLLACVCARTHEL